MLISKIATSAEPTKQNTEASFGLLLEIFIKSQDKEPSETNMANPVREKVKEKIRESFKSNQNKWGTEYTKERFISECYGERTKQIVSEVIAEEDKKNPAKPEDLNLKSPSKIASPVGVPPMLSTVMKSLLMSDDKKVAELAKISFKQMLEDGIAACSNNQEKDAYVASSIGKFDFSHAYMYQEIRELFRSILKELIFFQDMQRIKAKYSFVAAQYTAEDFTKQPDTKQIHQPNYETVYEPVTPYEKNEGGMSEIIGDGANPDAAFIIE